MKAGGERREAGGALNGRTAVVTGASRGIGGGIAAALGAAGVRVVMIARSEATLGTRAAGIDGAIPIVADVRDPSSVEKATDRIRSELKAAPDILVNNAGIFSVAVAEETGADQFVDTLNTNLVAPFLFVRAFLGDMKQRGSGHIVTIGSIADRTIYSGNVAYSAAKYGLRAVHEVLRTELRGTGVKTSLISPAATNTDIWNDVTVTDPVNHPHSKRPMLEPEDVVAAVLYALTQPDHVNVDELRLSHS
ncbi:MAG TPA: SDR family NAD(P)-dependent oxidoreductase [Gemmatimonadaceae bacterium]|nr:SDR family NAD(P)-dependent oxidoreductase [Gemmatimonadaceae bacterium]